MNDEWMITIITYLPGGPYNKTPLGGEILNCFSFEAYKIGHSINSFSFAFTVSNPPMSDQCTYEIIIIEIMIVTNIICIICMR